ncbi:MAG: glycosyltransferase family 39 protein [Chloroflexi bacterium]|nr:glycosyltransferase family 39 protein [Chloroflexota bacterium]
MSIMRTAINHFLAQPGRLALYLLGALTWTLILLAWTDHFDLWPVALPLLLLSFLAGFYAWWAAPRTDRFVVAGILIAGLFLFMPPAEHVPLFGDAAIYPDTGALISRTGGLSTIFQPLAPLSAAPRQLFFVSALEQLDWIKLYSYKGLVYGAYYLTDPDHLVLASSRPPLVESWFAFLIALGGMRLALYATGIFAILSLVLIYVVGSRAFNRQAAVWAVLLLGLSYPQIYFGRAPYAEIFGQFYTWAGFYFALLWIAEKRPVWLILAFFFWVTTWAARLDAVLLIGSAGLLLIFASLDRDRRGLAFLALSAPILGILSYLGTNWPYVGATYEMYAGRWTWFTPLFLLLIFGLLVSLPVFWMGRAPIVAVLHRVAPVIYVCITGLMGFALLWSTVPNPWRDAGTYRDYQEIIWYSSLYLSPLFFWLAAAGIAWLLWRGYTRAQFLLIASLLLLSAVYFFRYTTAPVYPVALRRLLSDVLPLMALSGGVALTAALSGPPAGRVIRRWIQTGLGAATILWMLLLSWPIIQQHEAAGSLAFIEEFHRQLPGQSVFLFEQQDADSWVGWLASPLYSLYGQPAVLLKSDTPDPHLLARAVAEYEQMGQTVYVVSQHNPLPAPLLPPGYQATMAQQTHWKSSLIGQTRAPYPPPFWEFDHPVYVYELRHLLITQ